MFYPFEIDTNSVLIGVNDHFLTKEECEKVISYINKNENLKEDGTTFAGKTRSNYRKNLVRWIDEKDSEELGWLIDRFHAAFFEVNTNHFKFDLYGLTESIQFTEYSKLNDKYDYHTDSTLGSPVRKLSATVQLSDENSYKGCNVELKLENKNKILNRKQGSMTIFPSYILHRVTPLLEGTRYSLVNWVGGPRFK